VDYLLASKTEGVFVEIGAYDGEAFSNTLFFERLRAWRGLLVEPNPFTFAKILSKGRTCHAVHACVSSSHEYMHFFAAGGLTRATGLFDASAETELLALQHFAHEDGWQGFRQNFWADCYTLADVLASMRLTEGWNAESKVTQEHLSDKTAENIFVVDYLSIDVEGAEIEVLAAIDWGRVSIDIISVEAKENAHAIVDLLQGAPTYPSWHAS